MAENQSTLKQSPEIQIKPSIGEITPSNLTNNGQKDTLELTKVVENLRETTISGMIKLNNKVEDLTKNVTSEIKAIKDKFHVQKDYTVLQSEQIGEISAALSKAQGMFKLAVETGVSGYGKFAGMDDLVIATKDGLTANNLCVSQKIAYDFDEGFYYFCTQLSHSSGQWFRSAFLLEPDKSNKGGFIGELQSATTKMNRYAYRDILCIGVNDEKSQINKQAIENKQAKQTTVQEKTNLIYPETKKSTGPGVV